VALRDGVETSVSFWPRGRVSKEATLRGRLPTQNESITLEFDPLDLIERNLIRGPIIELGGSGRLMGSDLLGMLQGSPVKHVSGDASRAESMAASRVGEARSFTALW
jgi:hypothetical protein